MVSVFSVTSGSVPISRFPTTCFISCLTVIVTPCYVTVMIVNFCSRARPTPKNMKSVLHNPIHLKQNIILLASEMWLITQLRQRIKRKAEAYVRPWLMSSLVTESKQSRVHYIPVKMRKHETEMDFINSNSFTAGWKHWVWWTLTHKREVCIWFIKEKKSWN